MNLVRFERVKCIWIGRESCKPDPLLHQILFLSCWSMSLSKKKKSCWSMMEKMVSTIGRCLSKAKHFALSKSNIKLFVKLGRLWGRSVVVSKRSAPVTERSEAISSCTQGPQIKAVGVVMVEIILRFNCHVTEQTKWRDLQALDNESISVGNLFRTTN